MSYADALRFIAASVVLWLPGGLAYAGKWRRWTGSAQGRAFPYFPFGLAWMGAGTVLLGLFSLVSALGGAAVPVAAVVFGVPGLAVYCAGLAFLVRTPRRLLPRWFLEFRRRPTGLR